MQTLRLAARSEFDPFELNAKGVSDHAPIVVTAAPRRRSQKGARPIPKHIVDRPRFAEILETLVAVSNIEHLTPGSRLEAHKQFIREAADIVEAEASLPARPSTLMEELNHFNHVARVVAHNDVPRALKLLSFSELARAHIIVSAASVALREPAEFAAAFDAVQLRSTQRQIAREERRPKKRITVGQALERIARQWCKLNKCISLAGVLTQDDASTIGPGQPRLLSAEMDMATALGDYWRPTFSNPHTNFDEAAARVFLEGHAVHLDFSGERRPHAGDYSHFLRSVPHSATGLDGIP